MACAEPSPFTGNISTATSISRLSERSLRDSSAHPVQRACAAGGCSSCSRRRSIACVDSGWFILGPEVERVRSRVRRRQRCGVTPSASAIGTDAIALILRALGIGPGDEVITTPLSAAYTALAIMMTGATAGLCRRRRRVSHPRRGSRRACDHAEDAGNSARASLRTGGRHAGARARRNPSRPGARRRLLSGASGHCERPARSDDRDRGRVQFLSRPKISARWAMAGAIVTNDSRSG